VKVTETSLRDAFRIECERFPDRRGFFYEAFRTATLTELTGHAFTVAQQNYSVSCRDTIRGIHGTTLPPGQAKLVTCVRGAVLDVAVDLRVGSPTFGSFEITRQDAESGVALFLADGIGHGFLALTDDACMSYLCSAEYVPGTMIEVDALDPDIGIPWDLTGTPIRSDKDAAAPTLSEAAAAGILPTHADCVAFYAALVDG
jgi:NDP-hexose 3,5-(Or5-) epimerase